VAFLSGPTAKPATDLGRQNNCQRTHSRSAANCDLRQGFIYKKVPHITLGSIANNEPRAEETLYDQPIEDKKRLRVAGPFTVEALQSYDCWK